ncbi:LRR receptor-like serine/threonine-protein kinase EFR [Quercus robur]|uniref:LRR receptor-like serine/threonine-protein kinase EFR n=1 Tax=Quercus robur TaxID=38942 RepID=UPI00216140DE|nr:LRR receptor-like serine/threonine-protein kinase EFR [Quercus robur]
MLPSLPHKSSTLHCSFMFYSVLLPCFITLLLSPLSFTHAANGNETDRLALLAIRAGITTDPLGIMSSCNNSLHFYNWVGITCGQNQRVITLNLISNGLVCSLSPHIGNISFLTGLNLELNYFHDLGFTLPNLLVLNVGHNQFTGPLPLSLSNASNLVKLDTNGSNFIGKVTIDFGGLPSLWWLVLASNSLGIGEADDLSFFNSLSKCHSLWMVDLSDNRFGGTLPLSIANLSTQLVSLRLGSNQLTGKIPSDIKNIVNLTELTLEKNNLTGDIPVMIGYLRMLKKLDLSENEFSRHIPSSLANITQLYSPHLERNHLMGTIPPSLGNLLYLQELDLSHNYLSGTIPQSIMGLSSQTISLSLAQNQLTGSLPTQVGNLKNLGSLDLSRNRLFGEIPSSLGSCIKLEHLDMEAYGMGSKVSLEGDMYSYGILLLEMFTRKRPIDDMFKDGLDLHNLVKMSLPKQISEILDPLFVSGGAREEEETMNEDSNKVGHMEKEGIQDSLITIFRVGVACSVELPRDHEFHQISHITIVKEAWQILETTYEGTKKVKDTKLQMLTTRFEELRMSEDESFNSFYSKLNVVVIDKFNLGEKTEDSKVVRKILRSLPKSFCAKVMAIEESKDLDDIRVQELGGSLQSFELSLPM